LLIKIYLFYQNQYKNEQQNAVSSGLADTPIRWIVDGCVKFAEWEIRRGNQYDAIIMDPPSYGRGPKGEIFLVPNPVLCFPAAHREDGRTKEDDLELSF